MQVNFNILSKHYNSESSSNEEQLVLEWKESNALMYEKMKHIWAMSNNISNDKAGFDVNETWRQTATRARGRSILRNVAYQNAEILSIDNSTKVVPFWRKYAVAASLVGALLISGAIYWTKYYNPILTFTNANSEVATLILPDNSKVLVTKGTSISYPKYFRDSVRLVSLTGKANFQITKNKNQPFKIDTGPTVIRVLGTTFDLEANPTYNDLAVVEGLVALKDLKSGFAIKLATGQRALFKNGQITKLPDASELNFDEESVFDVLNIVSNYYQKNIYVNPSLLQKATSSKISGSLEGKSFDECLESLSLLLNAKYHSTPQGIEIDSFSLDLKN